MSGDEIAWTNRPDLLRAARRSPFGISGEDISRELELALSVAVQKRMTDLGMDVADLAAKLGWADPPSLLVMITLRRSGGRFKPWLEILDALDLRMRMSIVSPGTDEDPAPEGDL